MSIEDAHAIIESRAAELRAQLAAWPNDWRAAAERGGGVTLEIGCGHGHFIAAYAAAHREEPCLAIDIIAERLERAQKKIDRAGLANVALLRSEARLLLDNLPDWLRFRRVFVLFPDPWPKRRHHKNRLLQPDFLAKLAQHCTPDARLYFRTDHAPYFEEVAELLRTHPDWTLADAAEPWGFEQESVFQKRAAGAYQSCIAAVSAPLPIDDGSAAKAVLRTSSRLAAGPYQVGRKSQREGCIASFRQRGGKWPH